VRRPQAAAESFAPSWCGSRNCVIVAGPLIIGETFEPWVYCGSTKLAELLVPHAPTGMSSQFNRP
jgi:hypothetical protein